MSHGLQTWDEQFYRFVTATWVSQFCGIGKELAQDTPIDIWQSETGMRGEVVTSPLKVEVPSTLPWKCGSIAEVAGKHLVYRAEDQKVLGVVGDVHAPNIGGYGPMWQMVATVLQQFPGSTVSCAGHLHNGTRAWICINIGEIFYPGDESPTQRYLTLLDGFDGSTKVEWFISEVRSVCQNTITFGMLSAACRFSSKHCSLLDERREEAMKAFAAVAEYDHERKALVEALVAAPYHTGMMVELSEMLLPGKTVKGEIVVPTRTQNRRDDLVNYYQDGPGQDLIGDNALKAVQAVAGWSDRREQRAAKGNSQSLGLMQFERDLWGTGAKTKDLGYNLVLQQVGLAA